MTLPTNHAAPLQVPGEGGGQGLSRGRKPAEHKWPSVRPAPEVIGKAAVFNWISRKTCALRAAPRFSAGCARCRGLHQPPGVVFIHAGDPLRSKPKNMCGRLRACSGWSARQPGLKPSSTSISNRCRSSGRRTYSGRGSGRRPVLPRAQAQRGRPSVLRPSLSPIACQLNGPRCRFTSVKSFGGPGTFSSEQVPAVFRRPRFSTPLPVLRSVTRTVSPAASRWRRGRPCARRGGDPQCPCGQGCRGRDARRGGQHFTRPLPNSFRTSKNSI